MAISVDATTNMTVVSNCDSSTGWATSESTYSGFQREGSACLGTKISSSTYHNYVTVSSVNLTGRRVYAWFFPNCQVDTKANGGLRIVLGDGTNRRAYYVGGSNDYGFQVAAWVCMVLDCDNLPTSYTQLAGTGAPSITGITQIGIGANVTSKAIGNVDNFFWDIVRHGTGIIVTSGATDDITFADIAADDASTSSGKAYGIIREIQSGVYGIQGDILFGNTSGGSIDLKDSDVVVIFEDHVHGTGSNSKYQFSGQHSATGTFSVELGTIVGSGDTMDGRNGVVFKNANPTNQPVDFDFDDTDIETVLLYGCTFDGLTGVISFSDDATNGPNHDIAGCSFTGCSQVVAGRVDIRNCRFINTADADAALLWNENIDIKYCQFIANTTGAGIEMPSAAGSPYTYTDLEFSGNTYDVLNSSGSAITVTKGGTSDPSTSEGSSVTFQASLTITIIVQDEDTNLLSGVLVAVYATDDRTELLQDTTDVNGEVTDTYTGSTPRDIEIRVRQASSGDTKYINFSTLGQLNGDFDYLVTMIEDPYNNAQT